MLAPQPGDSDIVIVLDDCCAGATKDDRERALFCVGRFATIAASDKVDFRN
jgi:hypothetical protein